MTHAADRSYPRMRISLYERKECAVRQSHAARAQLVCLSEDRAMRKMEIGECSPIQGSCPVGTSRCGSSKPY